MGIPELMREDSSKNNSSCSGNNECCSSDDDNASKFEIILMSENDDNNVLQEPTDMTEMKKIGDFEAGLVPLLGDLLHAIVERNDLVLQNNNNSNSTNIDNRQQVLTVFHGLKAPAISIRDYLVRIQKFSSCSPCCFLISMIYMDRYLVRTPGFVLSSRTIHRLLLTCTLLAAKFLDDFYCSNSYWASVGGLPVAQLNSLELELLFKLNFSLHVKSEEYVKYRKMLLAHVGQQQVQQQVQLLGKRKTISTTNDDMDEANSDNNNNNYDNYNIVMKSPCYAENGSPTQYREAMFVDN